MSTPLADEASDAHLDVEVRPVVGRRRGDDVAGTVGQDDLQVLVGSILDLADDQPLLGQSLQGLLDVLVHGGESFSWVTKCPLEGAWGLAFPALRRARKRLKSERVWRAFSRRVGLGSGSMSWSKSKSSQSIQSRALIASPSQPSWPSWRPRLAP